MLTRRHLFATAAPAVGAFALYGCADLATFEQSWSSFVATVQSYVSQAVTVIPTIEGIATTMASLFGPAWTGVVTLTEAVVNQVVAAITAAVTSLPPAAAARMFANCGRCRRGSLS